MSNNKIRVCICGAGLAGTMVASLIATLGDLFEIHVFEKRSDPTEQEEEKLDALDAFGRSTSATKRSINLALSHRGQSALTELGLLEEAMKDTVPMPGRVIHTDKNGTTTYQAYGKPHEAIHSVGRATLNNLLLNKAKNSSNVKLYFKRTIKKMDTKSGKVIFTSTENEKDIEMQFDLLIGADGAYSMTRDLMLRQNRTNFSRNYIAHGYKELCIPPSKDGDYALNQPNGLHIWPRGNFMLIALPNADKSFTATLFAPYEGADGFDSVDPNSDDDIQGYFARHFPEMLTLMPDLIKDYRDNPVGSLVTIRVNPWHVGNSKGSKAVLIGDAAHAVVPFYGQGMNAAFEDGLMLYEMLKASINTGGSGIREKVLNTVEAFATLRRPSADGLADLALEHYADMAANTASSFYLLQKRLEAVLHDWLPTYFVPIYTMVSFTRTPYHEAIKRAEVQDIYTSWTLSIIGGGLAAATGLGLYKFMNNRQ